MRQRPRGTGALRQPRDGTGGCHQRRAGCCRATLGSSWDGNPSMMWHSIQLANSSSTSYAIGGWMGRLLVLLLVILLVRKFVLRGRSGRAGENPKAPNPHLPRPITQIDRCQPSPTPATIAQAKTCSPPRQPSRGARARRAREPAPSTCPAGLGHPGSPAQSAGRDRRPIEGRAQELAAAHHGRRERHDLPEAAVVPFQNPQRGGQQPAARDGNAVGGLARQNAPIPGDRCPVGNHTPGFAAEDRPVRRSPRIPGAK